MKREGTAASDDNKLRAVVDGELSTASTAAELVHLLNVTARFRGGPEPSDAEFMREAAERACTLHDTGLVRRRRHSARHAGALHLGPA